MPSLADMIKKAATVNVPPNSAPSVPDDEGAADQTSSSRRSGSSMHSLTRTKNVTASRPSMMRWS